MVFALHLFLLNGLVVALAGVCSAQEVILERSNPAGVSLKAVPVSIGLPFPEGALKEGDAVVLVDSSGQPVPFQMETTSKWWSKDGSIQTILLSFIADTSQPQYRLLYGKTARGVGPALPKHPVVVSREGATVIIENGLLRARINGAIGALFEELAFDSNGDSRYRPDELVISPNKPSGMQMGKFSSLLGKPQRLEVEEEGPIRAVVRLVGHHFSAVGESAIKYDVRLYFFADLPYVRIDHTFVQDTDEIFYDIPFISLDLPLGSDSAQLTFGLDEGKAYSTHAAKDKELYLLQLGPGVWEFVKTVDSNWGEHVVKLQRRASGQWEWQKGVGVPEFHQILEERLKWASQEELEMWANGPKIKEFSAKVMDGKNKNVEAESQQAPGWVRVLPQGSPCALTAGIRFFWQLHPKEIAWSDGILRFFIYPKHIDQPLHFHTGTAKTHTLFLYLHPRTETQTAEAITAASFEPPLYFASPQWYCQSKVWGDIIERQEGKFALYEREVEREVERFITQLQLGDKAPGLFGMLNFGDYGGGKTGWNLETAMDHGFAYQFIRTGDRRVFDRFEQAVLHFRDVDVRQAVPKNQPFDWGLWLIPGYVPEALARECAADANLREKVFYWTGTQPPEIGGVYRHGFRHYGNAAEYPYAPMSSRVEARLRMYSGSCAVDGHGWVVGLVDHYFLTGDRRSLEVAELSGQWVLKRPGTAWGRDNWKYRNLARLYRATGKREYLDRLMEAIDVIHKDRESTVERLMAQDKTLMSPFYTILQFIAEVHRLTNDPEVRRKYLDLIDRWIENVPFKDSGIGAVFGYIRDYRDSRCHTDFADAAYAYLLTGERKYIDRTLNSLDFYLHFAYHPTAWFSVPEYLFVLDRLGIQALDDPPRTVWGSPAFVVDEDDVSFRIVVTQEGGYRVAVKEAAGKIEVVTPSGRVIEKPITMGGTDVHRLEVPADGEKGIYKITASGEKLSFAFGAPLPFTHPQPRSVEGKFGRAVMLADGARLVFPAHGNLNLKEGTIEFWFQPLWSSPEERTGKVDYHYDHMFDSRSEHHDYGFSIHTFDSGAVGTGKTLYALSADLDKADNVSVSLDWKRGDWHHIAVAWRKAQDGKAQLKLYVDGKLVASKDELVVFPSQLAPTFTLGTNTPATANARANGVFDEFRISNVMREPDLSRPLSVDSSTLFLAHFDKPADFAPDFAVTPSK